LPPNTFSKYTTGAFVAEAALRTTSGELTALRQTPSSIWGPLCGRDREARKVGEEKRQVRERNGRQKTDRKERGEEREREKDWGRKRKGKGAGVPDHLCFQCINPCYLQFTS